MRYWVYINDKVDGPYDETKLVTLNGFSQNTLICSEDVASSGGQEWVKASSVFEFDEIPVQEATAPAPSETTNNTPQANVRSLDEKMLLSKLNLLTEELSYLHHKLDSMQTDLDKAMEQNQKLSQQLASQSTTPTQVTPTQSIPAHDTQEKQTVLPAAAPIDNEPVREQKPIEEVHIEAGESFSDQANTPKEEEELIIRSALDSIYGEKPIKQPQVEEAFQDLLPEKEKEKVDKIEEELTFTPEEEKAEEPTTVKEALITTPSAEEVSRDELINELTASPKEDILDQIIQERQAQEDSATPVSEGENKGSLAGAAAVGAAALAGLAGMAAISGDKKEETPQHTSADSFTMATDKENPEFLEEVLPADAMPADVPVQEEKPAGHFDLDLLSDTDDAPKNEQHTEESQEPVLNPHEDTIQELVPGAVLEAKKSEPDTSDTKPEEKEKEEEKKQETPQEKQEEQSERTLTDKDLEDAFGPLGEDISSTMVEVPDNQSPNDLTEIELKEGSTYLISDFVPPAQVGDDAAAISALGATFSQSLNKQQETIIQDMLAVSNKAEKTQLLPTQGLPDDVTANRISLENTIQAKRGASLDIKTAPMVPEPADAPRLDVSELDDVNAQHDMKTSTSKSGLAKVVIGILVALLLVIVLYVALGMLGILPKSINLFSKPEAPVAVSTSTQEFLQEPSDDNLLPQEEENFEQPEETDQVLNDVQNLSLSNGLTLREFVEAKHASISKELISWEVANAVEPENYSVTIKVPPENPQNFKTVYRFNYNMENGLLEPTISDAKNLLDQAAGQA